MLLNPIYIEEVCMSHMPLPLIKGLVARTWLESVSGLISKSTRGWVLFELVKLIMSLVKFCAKLVKFSSGESSWRV